MRLLLFALLTLIAVVLPPKALAQTNGPLRSANRFHELFLRSLPEATRKEPAAKFLHLVPDENLVRAWNAPTVKDAMAATAATSFENLVQNNPADDLAKEDVRAIVRRRPITMVLVPGIFGEFIETRAYEDILRLDSSFSQAYKKIIGDAIARNDKNATDLSYSLDEMKKVPVNLDTLIQVGSIDDANGKPLVRVVLLFTPSGSLETLGPLKDRAALMNQRLKQYLALTKELGPQELVLVGYSRGTTYALEMLAQAKKENLDWLPQVKGMVALSGVIWGSTSADEMTNPQAPIYNVVEGAKKLMSELKPLDELYWFNVKGRKDRFDDNNAAYGRFIHTLNAHDERPALSETIAAIRTAFHEGPLRAAMGVNSMGSMVFLFKTLAKLGLDHPVTQYSNNIRRAQVLVAEALLGAGQLSTAERVQWWKETSLPASLTYYSLTAAMANPHDSDLSKEGFDNPLTYANRSFEDMYLLQTRDDYVKASGVKLNDSQVAIPQAMFLPNVIKNQNPRQAPLKTKFLGTIGTHHWGAALRIVFKMQDGRTNPFPRTALMQALAAQVVLDQDDTAGR